MQIDVNSLPLGSYVNFIIAQEVKTTNIRKVKITLEGFDKITELPRKVEIEKEV